ncbi:MAG: putative zinc-binding protein [Armatimonadetes bacterium]|nr:putative zinc-binding protein [Armatimonadota bacterium]
MVKRKNVVAAVPECTVIVCSGACNVGQITNEVGKRLDTEGTAQFFCLAGIGGCITGMVASVGAANKVLMIDGCPFGCGKIILDSAGIEDYEYMVVTDLGIEKVHNFAVVEEDVLRVLAASRERFKGD